MTFVELAGMRRSIRRYVDRPVPESLLEELLAAAHAAPSAGNLQARRFFAVTNRGKLDGLARCLRFPMPWFPQARAAVAVALDLPAIESRYHERGRTLFAIQDAAAATQNLLLAAAERGLGACWIGSFDEGECARTLALPEGLRPVTIVSLGYPDEAPDPRPRLPLHEVVTFIR